jgi:uncharacterized Ntn-hydrolase superfamily protein
MKINNVIPVYLVLACGLFTQLKAQDTFSIVGADSVTREVGSAGASCVDLYSAIGHPLPTFISDVLPDTGAINTQANYDALNQSNARTRMRAGDTPAQIISWLTNNDVSSNPQGRQYGIVGFNGSAVNVAGFTGTSCLDYKNNISGKSGRFTYSIQGNILLGPQVLDSMQARFIRTPGDLACKLMAALQGAKMVGADTRCSNNNTSSLFSFLQVAQPTDAYGSPSLLVAVKTHNNAMIEPIDSLQILFNAVKSCTVTGIHQIAEENYVLLSPNPAGQALFINIDPLLIGSVCIIRDVCGNIVAEYILSARTNSLAVHQVRAGIYFAQVGNRRPIKFIKTNQE